MRSEPGVTLAPVRALADQAFSRAAGAPLIEGNRVELLRDAKENYPAWLAAIDAARDHIHFENYIIRDDDVGTMFADALIGRAQAGVRVRVIYDWLGGFGKTSRRFWNRLRNGGVELRCYNPPRWDSPLSWLGRDHRKTLSVDGDVAFVTGLCVGQMWVGVPEKGIAPWRDTGVAVRGPAVLAIERAFADVWAMLGPPLPEPLANEEPVRAGDVALRVVATLPSTAGLFRIDQLVASLARKSLWLTDAYFQGTTNYVHGLRAAARDGVDVRLLLPNATDIPLIKPLSRAGYRPLLESGVRLFEWNGTMLHAKTAVADSRWARVGSSNLNLASWLGNCEMDIVVEDVPFAQLMEEAYLLDLENATEIVLDTRRKVRAPNEPPHPHSRLTSGGGGVGRAAVGAARIGNAVGQAFTDRRVLETIEGRMTALAGVVVLILALVFAFFPRALAYPLVVVFAWIGAALLSRSQAAHRLRVERERSSGSRREPLQ
jgi:cardiolipin synthase